MPLTTNDSCAGGTLQGFNGGVCLKTDISFEYPQLKQEDIQAALEYAS